MKEITKQFGKTVGVVTKDLLVTSAFSMGCGTLAVTAYNSIVGIVCAVMNTTIEGRLLTAINVSTYLIYIAAAAGGDVYITNAMKMQENESKEINKLSEMILESKPKNLSAREISVR